MLCSPILFNDDMDHLHDESISSSEAVEEGDKVAKAVRTYLREDGYGRCISLPVIRVGKGSYLIGLLGYSLVLNEDGELVGSSSGIGLTEMIRKTHERQLETMEKLLKESDRSFN